MTETFTTQDWSKLIVSNSDERFKSSPSCPLYGCKCPECFCDLCGGSGQLFDKVKNDTGYFDPVHVRNCPCMKQARSSSRIRESKLEQLAKKYQFDNFQTDEPWQAKLLEIAQNYAEKHDGSSLFVSGSTGCGKTHIATATCFSLLNSGYSVTYMNWQQDCEKIKESAGKPEYQTELRKYLDCDYLYIDDLLKFYPHPADLKVLWNILDTRYKREKPVIVTCERDIDFLGGLQTIDVDCEAMSSRLAEMCGSNIVKLGEKINFRYTLK